ncbi:hypothetical protein HBA55_29660 [Pseudomaricurvus alkylphenolicus]|uniref:hypothetical protein n=1 Tax=Pseudomaricurvus alkylphenolicus TaxID=1306991 RepID=UPI001423E6D2|nr:hypothetical protein [Pseudomaricurvus alkylphenolicus]NIB43806.1 hypothetical protein [Pseudomaricurvus alkylphenolicus]
MGKRTANLTSNQTVNFGKMIDPIISVAGATWGGGNLVVKFDGVQVAAAQTADFYETFLSEGRPVKVTVELASATSPDITVNALFAESYGRARSA